MKKSSLLFALVVVLLASAASAQNLIVNGTFDHDLSHWDNLGLTYGSAQWSSQDASASSSSGSAQVTNVSGASDVFVLEQCTQLANDHDPASLSAMLLIPANQGVAVTANLAEYFYPTSDCSGAFTNGYFGPQETATGSWLNTTMSENPVSGSKSVSVQLEVYKPANTGTTPAATFWDNVTLSQGTCISDATHLCLTGNRFRVSVDWTDYNTNVTAAATAVPFVDESGFFYFQDPANIEIMVKVHDACTGFGHFWFFSAATTNVAYTITVVDTKTGQTETYSNPAHVLSAANTDQSSFNSCP